MPSTVAVVLLTLTGLVTASGLGEVSHEPKESRPAVARSVLAGPAVWPVRGSVVRGFDPPAHPWLCGHRGVDISAAVHSPVVAARGGTVAFVGAVAGVNVVVVEFAPGLRSTYQPVLAQVHTSQSVSAGDTLGMLESSDHCPRACLHLGVKDATHYLEPLAALGLRPVLLPLHGDPVNPAAPSRGFVGMHTRAQHH